MRLSVKTSLTAAVVLATTAAAAAIIVSSGSASPANPLPPRNIAIPTITGLQVGETLTVSSGTWNGNAPITYYYDWHRSNGADWTTIPGAAGQSYTLTDADVGHNLFVQVKAVNEDGPGWANSLPTSAVAGAGTSGTISLPGGLTSIPVENVALPTRLVVSAATFAPATLKAGGTATAKVTVLDTNGHAVRGALVQIVGLPFGSIFQPAEVATGDDGTASIPLKGTARLAHMPGGAIGLSIRARKNGDDLQAGVSGTRLYQLKVSG